MAGYGVSGRSRRVTEQGTVFSVRHFLRNICAAAAVLAAVLPAAAAAETRTFVVGYFGQATYSQDSDCPSGVNPDITVQYLKNLRDLGLPEERIQQITKKTG